MGNSYSWGSGQKQVRLVRLGPKTGNVLKSSQKCTHEPRHWSITRCLFYQDKVQAHPRLPTLLDLQLFLFRSQSEILHSSTLYAPYTNADARGDPLRVHNPHHATKATHVSACLAAAAQISAP